MQQRDYTYNRQRYTTELQEVQRTYQVPITEYQWKAETHRSWNPFEAPYVAYRLVPQTRWETRSETVKIPVAKVEVVPEKITRQEPVTTHRIAQEKVITRVAIGPSASHTGGAATMARWQPTGAGERRHDAGFDRRRRQRRDRWNGEARHRSAEAKPRLAAKRRHSAALIRPGAVPGRTRVRGDSRISDRAASRQIRARGR